MRRHRSMKGTRVFGMPRLRHGDANRRSSQLSSAAVPMLDLELLEPVDAPMSSSDWADLLAIALIILFFP